jgi:hypothetical protein
MDMWRGVLQESKACAGWRQDAHGFRGGSSCVLEGRGMPQVPLLMWKQSGRASRPGCAVSGCAKHSRQPEAYLKVQQHLGPCRRAVPQIQPAGWKPQAPARDVCTVGAAAGGRGRGQLAAGPGVGSRALQHPRRCRCCRSRRASKECRLPSRHRSQSQRYMLWNAYTRGASCGLLIETCHLPAPAIDAVNASIAVSCNRRYLPLVL